MTALSTTIKYDALRSIDSATFTGSYLSVGTPTVHGTRIFKIVNQSNVDVIVSLDGVVDMDIIPAKTFTLYDVGTNKSLPVPLLELAPTQFFVKGSAGSGLVYIVCLYS